MTTERDVAVEKVLAALGRAQVPEGLAARVADGLERRAAAERSVEFGWKEMFARSPVAGIWWRGALAGAAASMLAVGVVMLAGHLVRGRGGESVVRLVAPSAGVGGPGGAVHVAASEERREPCANGSARHGEGGAGASRDGIWRGEMMRVQSGAPSQPFVALPLTAQEQALVRMAREGDAKELAMLNPEVRERQEAEDAAQFQKFFAGAAKPQPIAADAKAQTAETVVGGPGLAVPGDDASAVDADAAGSSGAAVSEENR